MPYESTTWKLIRQQAGRELGVMTLIPNGKITAFAAGSITSPDFFQDSGKGTGSWNSYGLHRPDSATAADNWRLLGDLGASGLINQRGANYADTTVGTEQAELWKYGDVCRPDLDWIDAANKCLKDEYLTTFSALSHLSVYDGDMSKTTDTDWTDVGTTSTSAKVTTADRTPYGIRSYHLVNTATNSGTRSTAINLAQARYYSMFAVSSVAVGTASLQPYNATTSSTTDMPTAITHSEAEPQLMVFRMKNAPTTCHAVAMNMLNTSATGDHYWGPAWLYNLDNLIIRLPSYVSEGFKLARIFQLVPRFSTSTTGQSIWNAQGVDLIPLQEGVDFKYQFNHFDANPYSIIVADRSAYQWPLVAEIRRPAYDFVASGAGFAAESDTFPGPLKTFIPRLEKELLERVYLNNFKSNPVFQRLYNEATTELRAASYARDQENLSKALPFFQPTVRM